MLLKPFFGLYSFFVAIGVCDVEAQTNGLVVGGEVLSRATNRV